MNEKIKVTVIGAVLDLGLGLLKVVFGTISHSAALVADGVHSFSDVATDGLVIWATKFSASDADENHPYGHQRFETLATAILGAMLIFVAGALVYDGLSKLLSDEIPTTPEWPVLAVASLSIVSKEWIYHYTKSTARKHQSNLLEANAWHSRSDAISSLVVLIGAGASMLGISWADSFSAVLVAIFVAKIGWDFTQSSLMELVDTGISKEEKEKIEEIIISTPGVLNVHDFRSRKMGNEVFLDVHICVASHASVSEGHQIGVHMEQRVKQAYPQITDLVFHIDTEIDHLDHQQQTEFPSREELLQVLSNAWKNTSHPPSLEDVTLHFHKGTIGIEVFMPLELVQDSSFDVSNYHHELLNRLTSGFPQHTLNIWYGTDKRKI